MVVDDDDSVIKTMEIVLKRRDYETLSAYSGEKCLQMLENSQPDLILLDIMMPGMDGWETLEKIRKDESLSSIPVIILSAKNPSYDILSKKEELGFIEYVKKPFELRSLLESISKAVES